MNDRDYWESVGETFEEDVFDVFANDKDRVIAEAIEAAASPDGQAADFGCGIGKMVPFLSDYFARVHAFDFSEACLKQGRDLHAGLTNVSWRRFDMCSTKRVIPAVDLVLSVNALLTPDLGKQVAMFQTLGRHLKKGGRLVLVAPALESSMLARDRMVQWNVKSGMTHAQAVAAEDRRARSGELNIKPHGIVEIDGAETKHFLEEELWDRLSAVRLEVADIVKIEYDWSTEFINPPSWMKAPFPWDWCVTAIKR